MAVETVEVYVEDHGHLPRAAKTSDRDNEKRSAVSIMLLPSHGENHSSHDNYIVQDPKSTSKAEN